jgi:hypothetical protein
LISVIIISDRPEYFGAIEKNIAFTIGVPFQLIHVKDSRSGICFGYNRGAGKAKYDVLCFVHDDVLFHTEDWGKAVAAHLQESGTGVIGVMGGRYKSANGLTWRDGDTSMHRYQVKDGKEAGKILLHNAHNESKSRVLCLDGAFMCCRKNVWEEFNFDEKTFTGFHFYDADFCMQVAKSYSNYVVYDILIEHFSQGSINKAFIEDSLKFEHKWKNDLPFTIEKLTDKEIIQLEGYTLAEKLKYMDGAGFKRGERWTLTKRYFSRFGNLYHLIRSSYFGILK